MTTNVTTNTPYIKILQEHDRRDAILGPPGSAGPRNGCGFYKRGKIFLSNII